MEDNKFSRGKIYIVGMFRYSDMLERKHTVVADSEAEAIKLMQAATWKFGYNEYYIVNEEDEER